MLLLEESEALSITLVTLEQEVIEAVAARAVGGSGKIELSSAALEGIRFLHSREYHEAKVEILEPLAALEEALESRIEEEVARRLAQHRQLRELQLALAVMLQRRGRPAGNN